MITRTFFTKSGNKFTITASFSTLNRLVEKYSLIPYSC